MDDRAVRSWGCLKFVGLVAAIVLVVGAGFWFLGESFKRQFVAPSPVTVAQASLEGLREQNRLSTFAARYVAVVTSKQSRLGMTAQKTLIMPGMVRYEVDLAKLEQKDLGWDAKANRLTITLPPLEVIGPDVDIDHIQQYGGGGLLMRWGDTEAKLDAANRKAAQAELISQAREAAPMKLAKESTRRAIERSFAMPLKAAGMNASVRVFFAGERNARDDEQWDVSRSVDDVLANKW